MWKINLRNIVFREEYDFIPHIYHLQNKKKLTNNMYWSLVEKYHPVTTTTRFLWEKELNLSITQEDWSNVLVGLFNMVKPTKLHYLHYKIVTKILTTNVLRHKWDPNISKLCTFCQAEPETTKHMLVLCDIISPLWSQLSRICKYFYQVDIKFTPEMVILNNYTGKHKEIINYLIITLKHFVYMKKCFEETPRFPNYMENLAQWYFIDKCYANQIGKEKWCIKKWDKLF